MGKFDHLFQDSVEQKPLVHLEKNKSISKYEAAVLNQLSANDIAKSEGVEVESPVNPALQTANEFGRKLRDSGNAVLDKLQILDKPRNALASGVRAEYEDGDFAGGAERGWNQEEYTSTQQLFTPEERRDHPVLTTAAGVVGDVATDPLTYTPAAVVTAPLKVAKGVAKATKVTNIATKIADTGPFRAFNFYVGDAKKAKELADRYRRLIGGTRYEIPGKAKQWNDEIEAIAREAGVDPDTLKTSITDRIETGGKLKNERAEKFAQDQVERNMEMLAKERAAGVDVGDLGPTYMAHVLTEEGRNAKTWADRKKVMTDFLSTNPKRTHPSAAMRKLEGTVAEINSKQYYGTEKFFETDPVTIMAVREMRHAQAMAGAKYLDEVGQFGVNPSTAPKHFVEVPGVKGKVFDPSVAEAIKVAYGRISAPNEMADLIKMYDAVQTWWKMWSLGARPAYHARNEVGNVWNAYLGGLTDPQRFREAKQLQDMMSDGAFSKGLSGQKISGLDADMVYATARDNGILGRGQFHADIHRSIQQDIKGSSANPITLKTDNPILQGGFKFGQFLETNSRLALYIDRLKKGDSVEDAAAHVNKYLFDYDDLSSFEETVAKRVFPFYTWTRKNIPLQLEAMVKNPDKMQKINILRGNIQQDANTPDPEYVQDYVKDMGPIYFGRQEQDDLKKVFTLMNYHPTMDVGRLLAPEELIGGLVSPLIKTPIELFSNYDTFRRKAIKTEDESGNIIRPNQTVDWMGVRMPAYLAHVAKNIVMLNEIDRANPFNVFGESTVDPETGEHTRGRSFGLEREYGFTIPEQVPMVGGQTYGVGTTREARVDLPGSERLLQYALGVRAYAVDEEKGANSKVRLFKRDMSRLKYLIKNAGLKNKPREIEELEATIERVANDWEKK